MPDTTFSLSTQLHSFPPLVDQLGLARVIEIARQGVEAAGIQILIAGGIEIPALYHALADPVRRPAPRIYLWFPVLADFPGYRREMRAINDLGLPSPGWGGSETQEEVGETFEFACPNHPETARAVLAGLERQLREYPFDGVFLDKIRFPSPANGIDDVLTCFCPHCQARAAEQGLDLDAVRRVLSRLRAGGLEALREQPASGAVPAEKDASWLDLLLSSQPLLCRFIRFRADSVTRIVEKACAQARSLGREVALDLFSPSLAELVGQDITTLAGLAAWIKPMSYRYANGPAGLRHELPRLLRGLAELLKLPLEQVESWAGQRAPGLERCSIAQIEREGAPLDLIAAETRQAARLAGGTPVYMGVEAVSIPAFQIQTTPEYVASTLQLVRQNGAVGAVLSWDLLNMPLANLQAAGKAAASA